MPGRNRVTFNARAFDEILTSTRAQAACNAEAQRIANACNAESSWGGYKWEPAGSAKRARARVWAITKTENRAQRLARNL